LLPEFVDPRKLVEIATIVTSYSKFAPKSDS